jgi:hypothetical protein
MLHVPANLNLIITIKSSVVSSQPARPAASGCVGLIKKPGWLFQKSFDVNFLERNYTTGYSI